ncbi:hypothetical protein PLICRDRAFT_170721 [Plicaturopsis crispa FD-325 SS-3]|nr:hypothetical protein PLICRDRAFT_170721 [Plicaturopsis crispa FD-325 SS-3]
MARHIEHVGSSSTSSTSGTRDGPKHLLSRYIPTTPQINGFAIVSLLVLSAYHLSLKNGITVAISSRMVSTEAGEILLVSLSPILVFSSIILLGLAPALVAHWIWSQLWGDDQGKTRHLPTWRNPRSQPVIVLNAKVEPQMAEHDYPLGSNDVPRPALEQTRTPAIPKHKTLCTNETLATLRMRTSPTFRHRVKLALEMWQTRMRALERVQAEVQPNPRLREHYVATVAIVSSGLVKINSFNAWLDDFTHQVDDPDAETTVDPKRGLAMQADLDAQCLLCRNVHIEMNEVLHLFVAALGKRTEEARMIDFLSGPFPI